MVYETPTKPRPPPLLRRGRTGVSVPTASPRKPFDPGPVRLASDSGRWILLYLHKVRRVVLYTECSDSWVLEPRRLRHNLDTTTKGPLPYAAVRDLESGSAFHHTRPHGATAVGS